MWGLRFNRTAVDGYNGSANNRLVFSPISLSANITFSIKVKFENWTGGSDPGTGAQLLWGHSQRNSLADEFFNLRMELVNSDYKIRATAGGSSRRITSTVNITTGVIYDIRWVITGASLTPQSAGGTAELFIDNVSQGTSSVHNYGIPNAINMGAAGIFDGLAGIIYEAELIGATYHHKWTATDSNRDPGAQPILTDIIGTNHAQGYSFPTDGSRWINDIPPGPAIAVSGELRIGQPLTLSYSNFAGQPTGPVTISDGTNVVTLTGTTGDFNAGAGTFVTQAFPALPTAGNTVTPYNMLGTVTVTLPDPGA